MRPVGARGLTVLGSVFRLAYGVGAFAAPRAMEQARLAAQTEDRPDPRLLQRAFGAHQVLVAAFTLAALRSDGLLRPAIALSALLDGADTAAALAEVRARGGVDRTLAGGLAVSGAGVVTFVAALRALER
jgi:hypothetical protein